MPANLPHTSLETLLAAPPLALLGLAAGAAAAGGELDEETMAAMGQWVADGGLAQVEPTLLWPYLVQGLMAERPSRMLDALRDCGALMQLLPELALLFGSDQSDSSGDLVDIGRHQLRVVDQAARRHASLPVRVAALLFNLGKSDSPPQHLPTHYRHVERCLPRIQAVCARFGIGAEIQDFAILVTMELERVHRASRMRAGAVTALLERVDAFDQPQRFADLMTVCACDYGAYPNHAATAYPKAVLIDQALQACQAADREYGLTDGHRDPTAVHDIRALAVAHALRASRHA